MILAQLQQNKVKQALANNGVVFAALFGSQAREEATDTSDVDILVKFQKGQTPSFFQLDDFEEELKKLIGKKIDLVTVNSLSPYLRDEILQSMQIFYEKQPSVS
ncbi:nucleotidyltransferase family protein [Candidatus Microgenomates bacterium]|nr:nucleotidyltransferase family protein [Candidatus Microgenomates bacterium]